MLTKEECQEKILLLPFLLQKVKLLPGLKAQSSHISFQTTGLTEVEVIKLPGQDPCSSEEDWRP